VLAAAFVAALSFASPARAQEWSPDGKGTAGGALLLTELTLLTETAAGVEPLWAYVLGGTVAAGVGGLAGRAVERDAEPEASGWLLGAGLALLIPTVIWVGNAHQPKAPRESPRGGRAVSAGLYRAPFVTRAPAAPLRTAFDRRPPAVELGVLWGSF
jgi:hypothetical protein